MSSRSYICIQCGQEAKELSKTYAKGNLVKLSECTKCGQLVDKFVEYDIIIVILNLILQDETAYRHLLFNARLKSIWKLGLLFLLTDSYCFWCFHKEAEKNRSKVIEELLIVNEIEINFYHSLLRSFLNSLLLFFLILLTGLIRVKFFQKSSLPILIPLIKGFILSTFANLFELIRLIWSNSSSDTNEYRMSFRDGIQIISLVQSYRVVTGSQRISSFCLIVICFLLKQYVFIQYDLIFPLS